jgi:hypothetical protein
MRSNPLTHDTFFDADRVADAIAMLWRSGSRHPQLAYQARDLFPGLPLETFNKAADVAWNHLSPEERQAAIKAEAA